MNLKALRSSRVGSIHLEERTARTLCQWANWREPDELHCVPNLCRHSGVEGSSSNLNILMRHPGLPVYRGVRDQIIAISTHVLAYMLKQILLSLGKYFMWPDLSNSQICPSPVSLSKCPKIDICLSMLSTLFVETDVPLFHFVQTQFVCK